LGISSVDALRLFFEDVAHLSIIEGKRDYLPLTRRIRRGTTLDSLPSERRYRTNSLQAIIDALTHSLADLKAQCRRRNRPSLDLGALSAEVEPFFDTPDVAIPAALAHCLGKPKRNRDEATEAFEELGWRCFYIVPPKVKTTKQQN